jgi:hypothetical protein
MDQGPGAPPQPAPGGQWELAQYVMLTDSVSGTAWQARI